ncbi:hypothetical protein GcM1_250067 [Golovinomyces cichoracearum]|uniref:SRR1-like domain-containing protein n=1 Tax=Golovinomyces cichoracearum TaxID=62708 RepID=A0A420IAX0_9PEZI|nr:hypothetical protein GcM1_250067 [Golovinomyces cichoracearum]
MHDMTGKEEKTRTRQRCFISSDSTTNKPSKPMRFTKRKEVLDTKGWTHVIDKPRKTLQAQKISAAGSSLQIGDFEINGISYLKRTLEEVKKEFHLWQKQWEGSSSCADLKKKIINLKETSKIFEINDLVVLGIGSLLSARREARRCSATQLAAVLTILQVVNKAVPVVVQDPQYLELDEEFISSLGWTTVRDPKAFGLIGESSLVFAIHCYWEIYHAIIKASKPLVLIGTKMDNFENFDTTSSEELSNKMEIIKRMVEDYQEIDFPQLRYDFSDTVIYWRQSSTNIRLSSHQ